MKPKKLPFKRELDMIDHPSRDIQNLVYGKQHIWISLSRKSRTMVEIHFSEQHAYLSVYGIVDERQQRFKEYVLSREELDRLTLALIKLYSNRFEKNNIEITFNKERHCFSRSTSDDYCFRFHSTPSMHVSHIAINELLSVLKTYYHYFHE